MAGCHTQVGRLPQVGENTENARQDRPNILIELYVTDNICYLSYFFLELDPPGAVAPTRLYLRGSASSSVPNKNNVGVKQIPFRLIRARFLVPFPPSQNPLPALPTSTALQVPQFSGLKCCSREQNPLSNVSIGLGFAITGIHTISCDLRVRLDDLFQRRGICFD